MIQSVLYLGLITRPDSCNVANRHLCRIDAITSAWPAVQQSSTLQTTCPCSSMLDAGAVCCSRVACLCKIAPTVPK
jgi:hypothetical protein